MLYNYFVFLLYKYTIMILKTSQNQKKVNEYLVSNCGKPFSLIEKINKNLFGSPKYLIKSITPLKFGLDFDKYTDLVYCTIELRKKGLAIYFRFKNEEYMILSRFNQVTYISSDNTFDFQAGGFMLNLKIQDSKNHKRFISRMIKYRNEIIS